MKTGINIATVSPKKLALALTNAVITAGYDNDNVVTLGWFFGSPSQRDGVIVAWHEVPGIPPPRKTVP
jgi:hypothetical protein